MRRALGITAILFPLALSALAGCTRLPALRSLEPQADDKAFAAQFDHAQVISTAHYRIYTTTTDQNLLALLPQLMERARANYHQLTGLPQRDGEPGKIYMLANRQQWAQVTRDLVGDEAPTYLSIQAGGYCYRGVGVFWDIGAATTMPVAAHEALHQFLASRVRDPLPMWLEEGLCVTAEGYELTAEGARFTPDDCWAHRYDLRNALARRHWLALRVLLPMDAGDAIAQGNERAVAYYAQLWALASYIRSVPAYRQGMERMIADAADGRLAQGAGRNAIAFALLKADGKKYNRTLSLLLFERYITRDTTGFEKGLRAHADKLIKTGR